MMVGFFRKRHFLNPFDSETGFTRLRFGQSLIPPSLPWFNLLATDSSEIYSLARLDHQKEWYSVQMRSACFCCLWILCTAFEQVFCESVSNDVFFRMLYWLQLAHEETYLLQSFETESYWLLRLVVVGNQSKHSALHLRWEQVFEPGDFWPTSSCSPSNLQNMN